MKKVLWERSQGTFISVGKTSGFADKMCSDFAERELSESSHAETFYRLEHDNRGVRPRLALSKRFFMRAAARLS